MRNAHLELDQQLLHATAAIVKNRLLDLFMVYGFRGFESRALRVGLSIGGFGFGVLTDLGKELLFVDGVVHIVDLIIRRSGRLEIPNVNLLKSSHELARGKPDDLRLGSLGKLPGDHLTHARLGS
jgi:hypothetical protein